MLYIEIIKINITDINECAAVIVVIVQRDVSTKLDHSNVSAVLDTHYILMGGAA